MFKTWFFENERTELIQQAKYDISRHRDALHDPNWDNSQKQMLVDDVPWKQEFIDLLEKEVLDQADVKKAIELVKKIKEDQNSHRMYLNTKDREWHRQWIQNYERWLAVLKEIISRGATNQR
jgi:hypothetical protein